VRFSTIPESKTPEPIAMKLGVHNYFGDPPLTSEYVSDRAAWGFWRTREISLFVTFLCFFLFFVSSTHLQVATVDRFSRSIHQMTRFCARKCLLWVSMMNFHICLLYPQNLKICIMNPWQLRTAITRASLKIEARCLHQIGGLDVKAGSLTYIVTHPKFHGDQ